MTSLQEPRDHRICLSGNPLRRWAIVLLLLLVAAAVAACSGSASSAPDFQLTRFDGSEFRLSEGAGRSAAVINFWYPSCTPCRAEMPAFEAAWQTLKGEGERVKFLGVFVPQGFDSEQDARDFVLELGLTYGFATDLGARVAQLFEVEVYPTTIFVNESGELYKKHISTLDEEQIVRIVQEMSQG